MKLFNSMLLNILLLGGLSLSTCNTGKSTKFPKAKIIKAITKDICYDNHLSASVGNSISDRPS